MRKTAPPLLILPLLLLTLPAGALQSYHTIPTQSGKVFRPVIDGPWIAWAETSSFAAYAHNITTGQTLQLSERDTSSPAIFPSVLINEASPWHPSIAIAGNRVVWTERNNTPYNGTSVRHYDLATNTRSTISPYTSGMYDFPAVSDNYAAYLSGSYAFYLYNFTTKQRTRPLWNNESFPDLDGPYATYATVNAAGGDIALRNLATGQTTILFNCNANQNPRPPIISGNLVAWSMRETTYGQPDVVKVLVADITTGQVIVACENTYSPEHRSNVALSGRTVIWEDWRQNTDSSVRHDLDLYGYNLDSKIVFPVATNPGNQHLPDMSGNILAFVDQPIPDGVGGTLSYLKITLPGDFNCDGLVNADDIDPFSQALTDRSAFAANHPDIFCAALDLTGDGKVDVQDINPFLKLAGLPAAPPILLALVPEPASAAFLLPTLILLTRRTRDLHP